jgi:hypothetical protein
MNFSHIPKIGILGRDKTTHLKRNLILQIQKDKKRNLETLLRILERRSGQVFGLMKNVPVTAIGAF